MRRHGQWQPQGVDHELHLAPLDALMAVDAALRADMLGRADAPSVYDAQARAALPAALQAHHVPQGIHERLDEPLAPPLGEVVEYEVIGREIFGQHTPLAASLADVQDGVHDASQGIFSPACRCWFQKFLQYLPLRIGKVGWVAVIHV